MENVSQKKVKIRMVSELKINSFLNMIIRCEKGYIKIAFIVIFPLLINNRDHEVF